jgi:hypothetical protein
MGLMEEIHVEQMKSYIIKIGENLHKRLIKENNYIKNYLI